MTSDTIDPKLAYYISAVAGYGHRLFIPASCELLDVDEEVMESSFEAHDLLKELSCWRGSDKRWVIDGTEHLGYEFSKREWSQTQKRLDAAGFTFKLFSKKTRVD